MNAEMDIGIQVGFDDMKAAIWVYFFFRTNITINMFKSDNSI